MNPETDICANRHGGNENSTAAHKSRKATASRDRETVERLVYAFRSHGLTIAQGAAFMEKGDNAVSGRFRELLNTGRIVRRGHRINENGNRAALHFPAFTLDA